jgi:hypothetical protein
MTSLWKMTQISKLRAGSQCAGHCPSVALLRQARRFHSTRGVRVPLAGSLTFHPLGGPRGSASASGYGACAARWLSGTVGIMVRGDGPGASSWVGAPGAGPGRAGASPWSRYHHSVRVETRIRRRLAFRSMLLRLSRRTKDCRGACAYPRWADLRCAGSGGEGEVTSHTRPGEYLSQFLLRCAHRGYAKSASAGFAGWFRDMIVAPGAARSPPQVASLNWRPALRVAGFPLQPTCQTPKLGARPATTALGPCHSGVHPILI